MAFQVSPGVLVSEVDATNVVPAVATNIGGFAGHFNWGPVNKVIQVSSENELAENFGNPDNSNFGHFLVAASYLKYGNALKVARGSVTGMKNSSNGAGILIENEDVFTGATLTGHNWISRYAGALGDSISIEFVTAKVSSSNFSGWSHSGLFTSAPGTSEYATPIDADSNDELHLVVKDEDGLITGTKGTVLEVYEFLSQASDAKDSAGNSLFFKDVINQRSEYIYVGEIDNSVGTALQSAGDTVQTQSAVTGGFEGLTTVQTVSLGNGSNGTNAMTDSELQTAYNNLSDADTVDISLLICPSAGHATANHVIGIAAARKDCIAFVSPEVSDTEGLSASAQLTAVLDFASNLNSSSYGSCDSSSLYVYDKYNDVYRYIAASGHIAGLCAKSERLADAWFSPAGFNRGNLLGITKLAFNPTQAQRDSLYKARVNPIISAPGQGTVLFGDKTLLKRPSAFDRINVRRLFIVLEKAVSTAAKFQLFEFNDEFTRAQFKNLVEPFLRDVKGRRGLTDFSVICDDTNNTSAVIDGNKFVADIFVKPARSINFIQLNFIATRTGVEFSEISS